MASQQLKRENKTNEQEKKLEDVPIATHYESLTVVDSAEQPGRPAALVHQVIDTVPIGSAGGIQDQSNQGTTLQSRGKDADQHKGTSLQSRGKQDANTQYKGPSLEEISKSRGTAQQQSMEAINRAATKTQSGGTQANLEKVGQRTGDQTKKSNFGSTQKATEKGAQETGEQFEKRQSLAATQKTENKGEQNKSKASGVSQTVREKVPVKSQQEEKRISAAGQPAMGKDYKAEQTTGLTDAMIDVSKKGAGYVGETISAGKDLALETGKNTAEYASKAAGVLGGVTGSAIDVGKKGASYVGEKAVEGKDMAVDMGKTTAEYAGKTAGVVEDAAVVAAWNAAELATDQVDSVRGNIQNVAESVVGVTDTAIDVAKKGASYLGGMVSEGKDVAVEMGKTTAEYAGKAAGVLGDVGVVAGWEAAKFASDKVGGLKDNLENVPETFVDVSKTGAGYVGEKAVAGKDVALKTGKVAAEYAGEVAAVLGDVGVVGGWEAAKFAGDKGVALEENVENVTDTMVDVSKKGASYIGEKAVAGKDVALKTGKATAEYAGEVAGVLEDVGVVGGWEAAKFAGEKGVGLRENIENATNTMADVSKRGASYMGEKVVEGKDITMETGKTAAQYAGEMAGVLEDVGVVAGWEAARFVGDKGVGLKENIENATKTMADVSKQGASYIGEKVVAGKDVTMETGKTTAQYAGEMAGVLEDVGVVAGWEAARFVGDKGVALEENVGGVIDTMADMSEKGVNYIGEKVGAGKDITMEAGKTTANFAGKVVGAAGDAAVKTGRNTAEFAGDLVGGMTQNIKNVTAGVARGVEDTTKATKDVVTNAGAQTKGIVSEREESDKDYALRTNIGKEREQQAKNSSPLKDEGELGGYIMKTRPIDVELEIKNQASGGGAGGGMVKVTRETTVEVVKDKTDKKVGRGG